MSQISNINDEYRHWLLEVCNRFCNSQIKAAVNVNTTLFEFYWGFGKDIVDLNFEKR